MIEKSNQSGVSQWEGARTMNSVNRRQGGGNKGKAVPIERLCVNRKTVLRARAKKGVRQWVDHGLSQGLKKLDHDAQSAIPCSPKAAVVLDDRACSEMEGCRRIFRYQSFTARLLGPVSAQRSRFQLRRELSGELAGGGQRSAAWSGPGRQLLLLSSSVRGKDVLSMCCLNANDRVRASGGKSC